MNMFDFFQLLCWMFGALDLALLFYMNLNGVIQEKMHEKFMQMTQKGDHDDDD